mmetsp:Transcript_38468/g.63435  ORF Transcript_38468/g.63435 Transcript_38468/m.63435 type:complete len:114 (+) Transcript_38468:156-497(+)
MVAKLFWLVPSQLLRRPSQCSNSASGTLSPQAKLFPGPGQPLHHCGDTRHLLHRPGSINKLLQLQQGLEHATEKDRQAGQAAVTCMSRIRERLGRIIFLNTELCSQLQKRLLN